MKELKPCPFCGKEIQPMIVRGVLYANVLVCVACCAMVRLPLGGSADVIWNNRPREDELKKRIDKLEKENSRLRIIANDRRPADLRRLAILIRNSQRRKRI